VDESLVSISDSNIQLVYNLKKTLPLRLEPIEKLAYRNVEVIIMNGYSSDETAKMAKYRRAKVIQVCGEGRGDMDRSTKIL